MIQVMSVVQSVPAHALHVTVLAGSGGFADKVCELDLFDTSYWVPCVSVPQRALLLAH